mgnify:FL=1
MTEAALALHRKAGDRAAALALATQLVADHPDSAPGYANRGALRREDGDTKGALADFRQAMRINPAEELAARGLADMIEATEPCGAADALDDFLAFSSPDDAESLGRRSDRLRERGDCRRERIVGGKAVVPFRREDDVMVVTVRVNDTTDAQLLLDTGASMVAFTRAFADRAGLDWRENEVFYVGTAGGVTTARGVKLESVALGAARVEGVSGAVVSGMDVGDDLDGLLGNTFLSHFDVLVDSEARTVTLSAKKR